MTPFSSSARPTTYAKVLDYGRLLAVTSMGAGSVAACVYFAPDSMWGRPVSLEVIVAGYMIAVGGPALAITLYGMLSWLNEISPAGTDRPPKGERFLYRTSSMVFGGAPMVWGSFMLVDWHGGGTGLPDAWLYLSFGIQSLAYVLALGAAAVFSCRRRRDALTQSA